MKGEWAAGKGSTPRPVNMKTYGKNFDSIFRKQIRNLFLDDERWPVNVTWVDFDYNSSDWLVVRTYDQFVEAIENNSPFEIISFDHDLDRSASLECVRSMTHDEEYDYSRVKAKTGRDCAAFLKQKCNSGYPHPKYLIHSLNSKGTKNIRDILGDDFFITQHDESDNYNKSDEILSRLKL